MPKPQHDLYITYGIAAMYGSSSTELAQQLALPPAPVYRSPWKHWWMWLLLAFMAMLITLVVPFPLTLWLVNREAKRRQRAYRLMTPIWEKAKRTWDGLYYCERNGGVFTPLGDGGTTFTPAADTLSYLFDHGESVRRAGLTYNDIKTL